MVLLENLLKVMPMTFYLTLKALHIIAVIALMAGLLYLPRLFVYHVDAKGEASEMLKIMERRLYKFIMNPALIATWVFGLWLIAQAPDYIREGWMHAKLLFVILLTGAHGYFGKLLRDFAADKNKHSAKFYRILNEIPTVLMIIIVFLVILKPF